MNVEIPRGEFDSPGPCWVAHDWDGKHCRPIIICKCGKRCHIDLHHVHADGTVTASFYDSEASSFTEGGLTYVHTPGCGWHVYLKLLDYDQGEFLPAPPKGDV